MFAGRLESRLLLFGLIMITAVFSVFALVCLSRIMLTLNSISYAYSLPPELIETINGSVRFAMIGIAFGALIVTALSVILTFVLVTRVYGPMVPARRVLKDMVEGRFGETLRTRHGDEFEDVVDLINQLSVQLAKDKGA